MRFTILVVTFHKVMRETNRQLVSTVLLFSLAYICNPSNAGSFDVVESDVEKIQTAFSSSTLTSRQLVQIYLDRINKYDRQNSNINSIITINNRALEEADALDKERALTGPRSLLHGIPILVKDNYDTVDMPTTAGCICLTGC